MPGKDPLARRARPFLSRALEPQTKNDSPGISGSWDWEDLGGAPCGRMNTRTHATCLQAQTTYLAMLQKQQLELQGVNCLAPTADDEPG